ncbi:MAG: PorT family protein [Bacteroidetes bacterium]|nr:PorT family protein [Bacteroidota bacterium]
MKKVMFCLLATLAMTASQAQISGYKIGIKVSPNISYMKSENGDITIEKAPLKFGFGLVVDKMFAEKYAIGTGVNVYRVGGKTRYMYESTENDISSIHDLTRDYKLTYVEVPLTLKLRTSPIGGITYWGQFGAGISYLYKAYGDDQIQMKYDNQGAGGAYQSNIGLMVTDNGNEIQKELMPVRASMIIAAGIEYPISGSTAIMAGITYNGGLISTYKTKDEVVKLTSDKPTFSSDKKSVETTGRNIAANLIELNVGIVF